MKSLNEMKSKCKGLVVRWALGHSEMLSNLAALLILAMNFERGSLLDVVSVTNSCVALSSCSTFIPLIELM